ncbi:exonuclease domain-containing protein [Xanthomarina gelatinilytica]|uniref:exonuclease domain-containing protein n=1 Tax=Xanthomarina gelatinilytica TaxID=1137281 RepID=UPI003AA89C7E
MQLNLTKPICFFDLETTGVNITNDRIVEISILKVYPDGKEERYTRLVNPTIPIPPEVTKVHGISDKDVADKPTFKELAKEIHNLIKDSDLGGFNSNRFDIPLLAEEMLRADIDFDMKNRMSIDVQTIFHKMEQRTLVAAYKFYCDKNLEDAHSAEADALATYEVLKAQVAKYDELENNTKFLAEFSSRKKFADFAGFLIYNKEGEECFSFGKHKGKRVVDILETEPGYFGWLLNADFPLYTKKVLTSIKLRDLNNKLD